MQDKLQRLLVEINLEDNLLSYFHNASIEKVIVYDNNKLLDFIINTENVLPIEVYNNVLEKLKTYFNTIEDIRLIIKPQSISDELIREYYQKIMEEISLDRNKYNIFLDRDVTISDNVITFKTYNKIYWEWWW